MSFADHDPDIRVLNCRCVRLRQWQIADLSAPYWRLYWNDRPGALINLKGRSHRLLPDRFTLIAPETHCSTGLRGPVNHFFLHFMAGPPFDRAEPGICSFPFSDQIETGVRDVISRLHQEPGGPVLLSLRVRALINQALSMLPVAGLSSVPSDERIQAAIRFASLNLDRPIPNAILAERAGMSASAFSRLFRNCTGKSPQAWLVAKRITRSCIMLAGTNRTIEDIAARVGFCDRYHFSRTFKKLRGTGPAEYRRRSILENTGSPE